jgi:hypothetical protein
LRYLPDRSIDATGGLLQAKALKDCERQVVVVRGGISSVLVLRRGLVAVLTPVSPPIF